MDESVTTDELIEVVQKAIVQADVIPVYARALKENVDEVKSTDTERIDWQRINHAILNKWSVTGLKHIKESAWKVNRN